MSRRNRQKLHKELRLAAEAAAQARLQARRAAAARQAATDAAIRRALHKPKPSLTANTPAQDAVLRSVIALMDAAGVEAAVRARTLAIQRAWKAHIPERYEVGCLPAWLLMGQLSWVRPAATWRSPGGSVRARRDSLAAHVLVRWPVPRFLFRALDVPEALVARVPEEDAWAVRLLAWVGQGLSPFDAVAEGILPVPLTRRMVNLFLLAKADTTPMEALRRAQVQAQGGPRILADAILRSRLRELRGPDPRAGEPFWAEVIGWMCRTPGLDLTELPDLVAYIEHRRRESLLGGPLFELPGRTAASLRRGMVEWRAAQLQGEEPLPTSGFLPMDDETWSMEELDSVPLLRAEGEALHHCVAMYADLIRRGKTSVWGLRRDGKPHVTVEVALGAARVVQARGACNRGVTREERSLVGQWAGMNGLTVAIR